MWIVGISCYYHDSAACIIKDGLVIAAAQEERFTRVKHDSNFPKNALKFCLDFADICVNDVSYFVFYEKPFIKFERIIQTFLFTTPFAFKTFLKVIPVWVKNKLFQKRAIIKELRSFQGGDRLDKDVLLFDDHHRSHAASAYFTSTFNESLIIVMDGVGEWNTTSISIGRGNVLEMKESQEFPHSIGLLYSAFTYFLGFKVNSGEYKVMGLAPYGTPIYKDLIFEKLVFQKENGLFELNMIFFKFLSTTEMTGRLFEQLFESKRRTPESPIDQIHFDIAASIQEVTSILVVEIVKYANNKYPSKNLCLSGGVALNCVTNQKISQAFDFENIWVPPAAGDAGGAMGAALDLWFSLFEKDSSKNYNNNNITTFFGKEFSDSEIENCLEDEKLSFSKIENKDFLAKEISDRILNDKVVGLFQGKAEFGPRALGNRSILGNAYSKSMKADLNLKIKFRESFRPFAPAVLKEDARNIFDLGFDSPYMLFTSNLNPDFVGSPSADSKLGDSLFPAVTHIDGSSRIQTVSESDNSLLYKILLQIKTQKGYGILANTSFNVRGEPIVNSPQDAVNCFRNTNMDFLVCGSYIISRKDNQLPYIDKSSILSDD